MVFALKPYVQAGRFEYHEPHNLNNFLFTFKGVKEEYLGGLRKLGFLSS